MNTSYQIGSARRLAAMTAVAAAAGADHIGDVAAFAYGFSAGLLGAARIATAGLSGVLLKGRPAAASIEATEPVNA